MSTKISRHYIAVYFACKRDGGWMTAKQLASAAGVSRRAAANHANNFRAAGLFDHQALFPEHVYRFSRDGASKHKADVALMANAAEAFDISTGD